MIAPTSTFITWRVHVFLEILRSADLSNASMQEHWNFVVDHVGHPYNKGLCMSGRGVSLYPT